MKDVLEEIVAHKRIEVEQAKTVLPESRIHAGAERLCDVETPSFKGALASSESGIIAEFKRRSPSKGWIKESGKPDVIPLSYQKNGAACVSILTDEHYFGGCDRFVSEARRSGVTVPVLYKNFIIDEYQLFQARLCGASAVLLIAACLTLEECKTMIRLARELGMETLLEMHSESELDYAGLCPDVCGINNRNLGTFVTDVENSFRLVGKLPADILKVSESGLSSPETVNNLRRAGYRGFLMGECFMKTDDPGQALRNFINATESSR